MAEIKLSNGETAMIDDIDLPKVNQYRWHRHSLGVCRWGRRSGSTLMVLLHRCVVKAPSGTLVKFKNGNKLDNRQENLFTINRQGEIWNLPDIRCACGCGTAVKPYTANGLPRKYANGHNGRKYWGIDGRKAARRKWAKAHPESGRCSKKMFYRRRKLKAMALLGNKCAICGIVYNGKNAPIFEFDHVNPKEKEADITRIMANFGWNKVAIEIKRCRLLCANCHNLRHGGEW